MSSTESLDTIKPDRLKSLLDSTSDWIWELDVNANFTYVSSRVKDLLGYEPDELIGKSGYDLMPPEEADKISAKFSQYVDRKVPFTNLININLHKDGHRVILESSGVPFFDDNGNLLGYRGVDRDVSDRYAIERSLECAVELYQIGDDKSVSELMSLGLEMAVELTESKIGYFHFINTDQKTVSLQVWSGMAMQECKMAKPNRTYSINDAGVWLDCFYKREPVIHNDYSALPNKKGLPEGHVPISRDLGIPVFEGDKITAILGVGNKKNEYNQKDVEQLTLLAENIWNIARRKRAEEALKNSEIKLHEIDKMRAIGQLAGGIAHDFNNQLSAILGFADLIHDDATPGSEIYEFSERIIASVTRSSDLTMKLLAFSRKGKYRSTEIDINEVIMEAITILERSIDKKIEIKTDLDKCAKFTLGDPMLLQNAILNIGINARDAIEESGEIKFSTSIYDIKDSDIRENHLELSPGKYVCLIISDTGEGMDCEVKKKIFEPFYTTKQLGKSSGMGLAAVFGTLKSHGGDIKVESQKGVGSIFKLYLPAIDQRKDKSGDNIEVAPQKMDKKHILLAEDEEIVSMMVKSILVKNGFEVLVCENGRIAVEYYEKNWKSIDLVILDMVMPEMSGKDAFARMKKINPNIIALLASGYSLDKEMNHALECGIKGFLQKPFRKEALLKTISNLVI